MPASSSCMQTADLIVHGSPAWPRSYVSLLYSISFMQPSMAQTDILVEVSKSMWTGTGPTNALTLLVGAHVGLELTPTPTHPCCCSGQHLYI